MSLGRSKRINYIPVCIYIYVCVYKYGKRINIFQNTYIHGQILVDAAAVQTDVPGLMKKPGGWKICPLPESPVIPTGPLGSAPPAAFPVKSSPEPLDTKACWTEVNQHAKGVNTLW